MAHTGGTPALPQPGDSFASLKAFEQAANSASIASDPTAELLKGKDLENGLRLVCKRGRRKPGRRFAWERRLEDSELCSFSLCAVLAEGSDPPAFVVKSYTPHHHLDQQLYTSSPIRAPRRVQPTTGHPPSPPISTPKQAPRRKSTSGGSTLGIGNARPRVNGRFVSTLDHPELAVVAAPTPLEIPLLPICPRRRPPPSPAAFSTNEGPRTLAKTDDYVAWGKKLGISRSETPSTWYKPAPLGRQLFTEWGWSPPGLDAVQEADCSDDGWTEDIIVDAAPRQDREDSQDLDYEKPEEQQQEPSSDGYHPRPLKRRRTSVNNSPHVLSVKPTTRASVGRARRRSSTTGSQSPELRRGFWAREDSEEGEATMTPDTPYTALRRNKEVGSDQEEEHDLPAAAGRGNVGLGLDLGELAGGEDEEDAEVESPVSVGSGRFSRQVTPLPPFTCDCCLGDASHRPRLRIDTSPAASSNPISSQSPGTIIFSFVDTQQSLIVAVDEFRPPTVTPKPSATTVDAPTPPAPPVSSSETREHDIPSALENGEPLLAPVEQTFPPPRSPDVDSDAVADAPGLLSSSIDPLDSTQDDGSSSPFLRAPSKRSADDPLVTTSAPSIGRSPLAASPAPVAPPVASSQPVNEQQPPVSPTDQPSPQPIPNPISPASALAFKPRRTTSKTHSRPTTNKPALQVALASAENASSSVAAPTREEVKPTAMLDLLARREEVKQLKARFFDASGNSIDPLYCSADLERKLSSLRQLGHRYTISTAYSELLLQNRPLLSQLPISFLHVARDSTSSPASVDPGSARPLHPGLVAATSYVWDRELGRREMEWLEREEKGLWRLVGEMAKVREVNERWEELGRPGEDVSGGMGQQRREGYGEARITATAGAWTSSERPSAFGPWRPDPKGDRWARQAR